MVGLQILIVKRNGLIKSVPARDKSGPAETLGENELDLINYLGGIVMKQKLSNNYSTLSLTGIPSGVYLCVIKSENETKFIQKVIVIK